MQVTLNAASDGYRQCICSLANRKAAMRKFIVMTAAAMVLAVAALFGPSMIPGSQSNSAEAACAQTFVGRQWNFVYATPWSWNLVENTWWMQSLPYPQGWGFWSNAAVYSTVCVPDAPIYQQIYYPGYVNPYLGVYQTQRNQWQQQHPNNNVVHHNVHH